MSARCYSLAPIMSDAPLPPPPAPKPDKANTPFLVEAAKLSWIAPIVAIVISIGNSQDANLGVALLSLALLAAGFVLGVIGLFGVSKYGAKRTLVPALIGAGSSFALLAFMIVAGVIGFLKAAESPVTDAHKQSVLTAADLRAFFSDFEVSPDAEKWKLRELPSSSQLEYVYLDDQLYLRSTLASASSETFAKSNVRAYVIGTKAGLRDYDMIEDSDFVRLGDESVHWHIQYKGEPYGHVVAVRRGLRVYGLTVVGAYFDSGEDLAFLLEPYVEPRPASVPGHADD